MSVLCELAKCAVPDCLKPVAALALCLCLTHLSFHQVPGGHISRIVMSRQFEMSFTNQHAQWHIACVGGTAGGAQPRRDPIWCMRGAHRRWRSASA